MLSATNSSPVAYSLRVNKVDVDLAASPGDSPSPDPRSIQPRVWSPGPACSSAAQGPRGTPMRAFSTALNRELGEIRHGQQIQSKTEGRNAIRSKDPEKKGKARQ